MIYGDNPQKINERQDALGLKTYTYVPQITAIVQAGNLYVYCAGNPLFYRDSTGEYSIPASIGIDIGAIIGVLSELEAILSASAATGIGLLGAALLVMAGLAIVVDQSEAINSSREAQQTRAWVNERIKSNPLNEQDLNGYSVYVITDNTHNDSVVYVGMTKSFHKRENAHNNKNYPKEYYTMRPVATGLNKRTARRLEQWLIDVYAAQGINNMINSIARKRLGEFVYEFHRVMNLIGCGVSE